MHNNKNIKNNFSTSIQNIIHMNRINADNSFVKIKGIIQDNQNKINKSRINMFTKVMARCRFRWNQ